MTENMKRFLEAVSANRELTEKVNTASMEGLISIARELDIDLSSADFEKNDAQPLKDDELNAVAGGGDCYCAVGGGGTSDTHDKTCACVMGGGGEYSDGRMRCACVVGGSGNAHGPCSCEQHA